MAINITSPQFDALSLIYQESKGRGKRGLRTDKAPGAFTRSIAALERRGYIARRHSNVGRGWARPATFFVPTAEGQQALAMFSNGA